MQAFKGGPTPWFKPGLQYISFDGGDPYAYLPANSTILDYAMGYYRTGGNRYASSGAVPGYSYTRSGADLIVPTGVVPAEVGPYYAYEAGVEAILAGSGDYVYEATTNKCTNYNAAPLGPITPTTLASFNANPNRGNIGAFGGDANTLFGIVDDTLNLMASGFGSLIAQGKMTGFVPVIVNAAGAAIAYFTFSGPTGNTNTHTFSAFIRGGSGDIGSNAVVRLAFTASATYRRLTQTVTAASNTDALRISANAGQDVYIILNQLEEKAYATPPVIVSGQPGGASRGAAIARFPYNLPDGDWSALVDLVPSRVSGGAVAMQIDDGTGNNRIVTYFGGGGASILARVGGVDQTAVAAGAATANAPCVFAATRRGNEIRLTRAVGGVASAVVGNAGWTWPTGLNRVGLGVDHSGTAQPNGPVRRIEIIPGLAKSDSELQAWAQAA